MEKMEIKKLENEAVRRLELFGISKKLLDELKEDFKLKSSDALGEGVHDINDLEKEILEQFFALDGMKDKFPYYVIPSWQPDGYCVSILFIDPDEDTWTEDIENLKDGWARAFVWNVGCPEHNDVVLINIQRDGDALHHIPVGEVLRKKREKLYGGQNVASMRSNSQPLLRIHNLNINMPGEIEIHLHVHTQH